MRAVYKTLGTQEIDVDVYLPQESVSSHAVREHITSNEYVNVII